MLYNSKTHFKGKGEALKICSSGIYVIQHDVIKEICSMVSSGGESYLKVGGRIYR